MLASFKVPMYVANDAWSFLYFLPLAFVLALVYKTTKIPEFSWLLLLRESLVLTVSIVAFMIVVAVSLYAFCALVLR